MFLFNSNLYATLLLEESKNSKWKSKERKVTEGGRKGMAIRIKQAISTETYRELLYLGQTGSSGAVQKYLLTSFRRFPGS